MEATIKGLDGNKNSFLIIAPQGGTDRAQANVLAKAIAEVRRRIPEERRPYERHIPITYYEVKLNTVTLQCLRSLLVVF